MSFQVAASPARHSIPERQSLVEASLYGHSLHHLHDRNINDLVIRTHNDVCLSQPCAKVVADVRHGLERAAEQKKALQHDQRGPKVQR